MTASVTKPGSFLSLAIVAAVSDRVEPTNLDIIEHEMGKTAKMSFA